MPRAEIFKKFKQGKLHSGSKSGPVVKSHKQAVAIAMQYKAETLFTSEEVNRGYKVIG